MHKAQRIYERRFGRIVGAAASLGGLAVAGVVAALRHRYAIDLSYATVTAIFGVAMGIGPIAGIIARGLGRRSLARRIASGVDAHPGVPAGIMERFVASSNAKRLEETSVTWPLANRAVMGVVGWFWALGLFSASGFDIVGKAFGFAMSNGALLIGALAGASYLGGRRLVRPTARLSVAKTVPPILLIGGALGIGLTNVLRADQQALAAVVYLTVGGIAVQLPSYWRAAQRLRTERGSLAVHALLPPADDLAAENQRLITTVAWTEGPPEVRAEALRNLLSRLAPAERGPHLDQALATTHGPLRRTALELCHKLRYSPPLERLLALTHEPSLAPEDAALLPALLHRHRAPEVQEALTHLLAHPTKKVRESAALSLGLVGSAGCVSALREAARSGGRLAEVCQQAIERIQIRLSQTPGQLSLVETPEGGALSEVEAAGSLTFTS